MEWLEIARQLFSYLLILSGVALLLIGAIGILRFPDFWARLHAASIIDTLGAILFLLGLVLQSGLSLPSLKLAMMGGFLLVTGPTAIHALASAAYGAGSQPIKTGDSSEKDKA